MTRTPTPPRRRPPAIPFAGLAPVAAIVAASLALHAPALGAGTWNGLTIQPEHRCSSYDRADYPYPQSVEREIVAAMGGRVYGPYTGRHYRSTRETDIEHVVALSEAHDAACAPPAPPNGAASRPTRSTLPSPRLR